MAATPVSPPESDPLLLEAQEAFAQGEHARATTLCARLLTDAPRHAPAYLLLASIAEEVDAFDKAAALARQALNCDARLAEAHLVLARMLPRLGRPVEASLHWQWHHHLLPKAALPLPIPAAIYYLEREEAAAQARVAPWLPTGPGAHGRMLCYHAAPPFPDAPPHLIAVEEHTLEAFLTATPLRRPTWVRFDPKQAESARRAQLLAQRIDAAVQARSAEGEAALRAMGEIPPATPWDGERPPRLWLLASRHDGEAYAAMHGLARSLRDLGCAVRLAGEEHAGEILDPVRLMDQLRGFAPHGVIAANAFVREFLHPAVFALSWWLEPPPRPPATLPPWGERDLLLHANADAESFLRKLGAPEGRFQPLCIEPPPPVAQTGKREDLLLVVADRPPPLLLGKPVQEVLKIFAATLELGEKITRSQLASWSRTSGMAEGMLLSVLYQTVLRERLPGWLEGMKGVRVAVLGSGWEEEPLAKAWQVEARPEGEALEGWYGRARWAVVIHPHGRGSRQAQEAAARGVMPVIFDGLPAWTPPRKQEPFATFHDAKGVQQAVADTAPLSLHLPESTFTELAERLLEEMRKRL